MKQKDDEIMSLKTILRLEYSKSSLCNWEKTRKMLRIGITSEEYITKLETVWNECESIKKSEISAKSPEINQIQSKSA